MPGPEFCLAPWSRPHHEHPSHAEQLAAVLPAAGVGLVASAILGALMLRALSRRLEEEG